MGEIRVLDKTGDTKVIWDKENEIEVEVAEDQFYSLLEKGFKAFKVKKDGTAGQSVKTFNSNEEKYIFVPALVGG